MTKQDNERMLNREQTLYANFLGLHLKHETVEENIGFQLSNSLNRVAAENPNSTEIHNLAFWVSRVSEFLHEGYEDNRQEIEKRFHLVRD